MVRLRRTARLEAEFITSALHPPVYGDLFHLEFLARPMLEPGLPASIGSDTVQALVSTFQRYESADENKLHRTINQLERIRRIRQGEELPAPAALDVSVHSEGPGMDSAGAVPNLVREGSQFKASAEVASANGMGEQDPHEVSESTKATEEPD